MLPAVEPTKLGYTFQGWYSDDAFTTLWDFINNLMPVKDVVFYAKWELIPDPMPPVINQIDLETGCIKGNGNPGETIVVTDLNGNVIKAVTVDELGNFTLCLKDLKSDVIKISQVDKNGNVPEEVELNVVYFDTNGGENSISSSYVVSGSIVAEPTNPVRNGYKFIGWNTEIDGSGSYWNFSEDKIMSTQTLYAQWELIVEEVVR